MKCHARVIIANLYVEVCRWIWHKLKLKRRSHWKIKQVTNEKAKSESEERLEKEESQSNIKELQVTLKTWSERKRLDKVIASSYEIPAPIE